MPEALSLSRDVGGRALSHVGRRSSPFTSSTLSPWVCPHTYTPNKTHTHLVYTPRISVEQNLHTIIQQLFCFLLRQERPLPIDTGLRLERFSQKGLCEMGTEACGKGWGGVGRAEKVDEC